MAKITTPVQGYTGEVVGVHFVDGVGETDNEGALAYFARHGYQIGEPEENAAGDEPVVIPEGKPGKPWNKPQLAAYAEREGIDLGDASTKDDILAVLTK